MSTNLYDEIDKIEADELTLTDTEKMKIMSKIRRELPKSRTKKVFSIVGKTAGTLAACYALLIGISISNPVFAESVPLIKNLPFMENILENMKKSGDTYQSPVILDGAVDQHSVTIDTSTDSNFKVTQSYFDGGALVLSTVITTDKVDEGAKSLSPTYNLKVNGTPFTVTRYDGTVTSEFSSFFSMLKRIEGNTFAGTLVMDLSDLKLTEDFNLELGISSITGIDPTYMVYDDELMSYREKTYDVTDTFEPITTTIKYDSTLAKTYEVGETQGDVTLNKLVVSPASTYVDASFTNADGADGMDDPIIMLVEDDKGQELEYLKYGFETNKYYYKPLLSDVTSVTAKFYRKDNATEPIAEFTIPVDGGFTEQYAPKVDTVDRADITYDPPLPEQSTNVRTDTDKIYQIGDRIEMDDDDEETDTGKVYATYSNMKVYDSYMDAGIATEDMNSSEVEHFAGKDGIKFVTLDVKIETDNAVNVFDIQEDEGKEYEKYDPDTSGTYWIASYCNPQSIDFALAEYDFENVGEDTSPTGELAYFSSHMHGFSNYYHFTMNPTDQREFVVGFYVGENQLKIGNAQVMVEYGGGRAISDDGTVLDASSSIYIDLPKYPEQ